MPKQKKIWNNPLFLWVLFGIFTIIKGIIAVVIAAFHRISSNRFWDRKFRKWEW